MRLPFEQAAFEELIAAAEFYENEREGHGLVFYDEVEAMVDVAADHPQSGRAVLDAPAELDVRMHALRRFPFVVVTAMIDRTRAVVALAHTSRAPGYWRQRVR